MINVALFLMAALGYAVSTVAHAYCWMDRTPAVSVQSLATSHGGQTTGVRASSSRCSLAAQPALVAAVVLHGAAIALRWLEAGYPPFANAFEALSFYAWGLALIYLCIGSLRRQAVLGTFVTPLALTSILVASVLPKKIEPLVPVLQSNWLPIHVGVSLAAYAFFTLAFVAATAYLLQLHSIRQPGRWRWARRLPPLEALEQIQRRTAVAGLVLMTGALLSGSLWSEKAWGVVWPWEPQQVAALVTWLIYAAYFYARHNAGWHDRRGAWLLVGGFISVIVTFVGADLLMPGSRHSFLFG
jgi:cytochrome c-type biogenesis protein CcsB